MLCIRHKWKGARRARAVLVPRHKESFRQLAQPSPAQPSPIDRYFIFFQNITAWCCVFGTSGKARSLYFVFLQNIPSLPVRQAASLDIFYFYKIVKIRYFTFLQNIAQPAAAWLFFIFTKYRILHFYKIQLHRPADRGPLRTQPSPVS